ncbi:MAG TPA: hypothetical protein VI913_00395 [Candidatus Peribacteraceae bacterium]|nr:hypothetical protein [Candidatus Peribacteraceae bacterium]
MNLTLSWDLLVIVFFVMVLSYSYIVGKDSAIKIIIAAYVAVLASHGLGNFLQSFAAGSTPLFAQIGIPITETPFGTIKLVLFLIILILLTAHGDLEIHYEREGHSVTELLLVAVFGFATAALLLATLLTFTTDASVLGVGRIPTSFPGNPLMNAMITYRDFWFALPALLLIVIGFIRKE